MDLVSVIVPVHNERATLAICVERLLAVDLGAPREVIVADDGSTDGSDDVARMLSAAHGDVRAVFLPKRRGKGAAVGAALAAARGTIIAIHDADLEYDAADVARAVRPVLEQRAEAVYGSRFAPGAERRVLYYRHAMGNRLVTTFSNLLTDLNLSDVETGCKVFRTDLVRRLPIRSRTFTFEIEITAKLAAQGARIYEVPISYHGRSYLEGKKISWVDGLWAFAAALRFAVLKDLGPPRAVTEARRVSLRLRRFTANLACELGRLSGNRVVQVLGGLGELTAHLVKKERVVCVERDAERAAFLRRRFAHRPNVAVVEGEPSDGAALARVAGESADTLVFVNSLCTLADDAGVLRACGGVLKPGGRLVAYEPAGQWLYSPIDRSLGRVRRYRAAELKRLIESTGFVVDSVRSRNRLGVLAWFLWGTLMRRRSATGVVAGLLDVLSPLWRALGYLAPLPGLSVLVTAHKRG